MGERSNWQDPTSESVNPTEERSGQDLDRERLGQDPQRERPEREQGEEFDRPAPEGERGTDPM